MGHLYQSTRQESSIGCGVYTARATIEVYLFLAKLFSEGRGFLNPKSSDIRPQHFLFLVAYGGHGTFASDGGSELFSSKDCFRLRGFNL